MNREKLFLTVPEELAGRRLDQALARLCPQHSRARLQGWIRAGEVLVDGTAVNQRFTVRGGESISINAEFQSQNDANVGEDIALDIIHEDQHLMVINKPAGLVTHPGAGNRSGTLLNALLHHSTALESVPRAGIVHRLDKDTSGIMVVAKTPESHTDLVDQLQRREVQRQYLALVNGYVTAGGTVDAPIRRHAVQRRRMAVADGGKPARTHYRIERRMPTHTLLRVHLETGRTHQIRVHMTHIGHPLVGDPLYGGRMRLPAGCSDAIRAALQGFRRQALHAELLSLRHPDSGSTCQWRAPVPVDMNDLLAELDRGR